MSLLKLSVLRSLTPLVPLESIDDFLYVLVYWYFILTWFSIHALNLISLADEFHLEVLDSVAINTSSSVP